jgi:O-antigen/teichoic acid export membrane protein
MISAQQHGNRRLKERLGRRASAAFMINLVGIGLALLSQLVLAHALGAEGYGAYAYVYAWISVLAVFAACGFPTAMLRFVSGYKACEQWHFLRGVMRYAQWRALILGSSIAVLGAGLVWLVRPDGTLSATFYAGLPLVPVLALLRVRASTVRALGRIVAALAPDLVVREAVLVTLVAGLAFATGPVAAWDAMTAALVAGTASLALVSLSLHRVLPASVRSAPTGDERAAWFGAATSLVVLAGLGILRAKVGVLLLGWLVDTSSAGFYAIAARIALLVAFPLSAVNAVLAPTIAAMHARQDAEGLQRAVTMAATWTALMGVAVALPLLSFPTFWLGLFGERFEVASGVLRVLLLGQIVNAVTGSVGFLMTMTGQERAAAMLNGGALLGHVALSVLLIPGFGIYGVAFAEALTLALLNLGACCLVWRTLRVLPGPFARLGA